MKLIKNPKIAIVGLGYVGLPLAVEFSRKYPVIGFDLDSTRINEIQNHYDATKEVSKKQLLKSKNLEVSDAIESIKDANVYIITVPTPVHKNNSPNLLTVNFPMSFYCILVLYEAHKSVSENNFSILAFHLTFYICE